MRNAGLPRRVLPVPRRFPAHAGKAESACEAHNESISPHSPQIRDDAYFYADGAADRNPLDRDSILRGAPSMVYPRTSGESGEPGAEAATEAVNPLPAPAGNQRGRRGTRTTPAAGWFCPVWFGQQPILGVSEDIERNTSPIELPADRADWPEEAREIWEERAAIIEFDGGLPREAAERLAEERVRLWCARPRKVPEGGSP